MRNLHTNVNLNAVNLNAANNNIVNPVNTANNAN